MSSSHSPVEYQLESLLCRLADRKEIFPALQKMVETPRMKHQLITPTVISRLCAETTQLLEEDINDEVLKQLQILMHTVQKIAVRSRKQTSSQSQHDGFLSLLEPAIVNMMNVLLASLHSVQRSDSDITDRLYEEVLETINVVADYSLEAKSVVARYFCDRLLHVVVMTTLRFTIRMETLKRLNLVLEKCSLAARDLLEQSPLHRDLLHKMARTILSVGDYEFQVAIIENLLRFTPKRARPDKANIWFPEPEFSRAFLQIRDSEFETDCRRFLNVINRMLGDKAMVASVPCLTARLGEMQLEKPEDDNYSDFWVDFNMGSKRITIFCEQKMTTSSQEWEDNLWETVSIWDEHVSSFELKDSTSMQTFKLHLSTNARDLVSFGPQFVSRLMVIDFARQHHVLTLVEKTFGRVKSAHNRKVSAVEEPIHVQRRESPPQIPDTIVEEIVPGIRGDIDCSQTSVVSNHKMPRKVSMPADQMQVSSRFFDTQAAASPCILRDKKNKAYSSPVGTKSKQSTKRVKTPLRLIQRMEEDSDAAIGPPSGRSKVSVPVISHIVAHGISTPKQVMTPPHKLDTRQQQITHVRVGNEGNTHSRALQQSDHADEIIPSSMPDEQITVVPDTQYPQYTDLPALRSPYHLDNVPAKQQTYVPDDSGISMSIMMNGTGDSSALHGISVDNNEDLHHHVEPDSSRVLIKNGCKVSLTPALSTVAEESATPGTGCSSHKSLTVIAEEDPISILSQPASLSQVPAPSKVKLSHRSPQMSPDSTYPTCIMVPKQSVVVSATHEEGPNVRDTLPKKIAQKKKPKRAVKKQPVKPNNQRSLRSRAKAKVQEDENIVDSSSDCLSPPSRQPARKQNLPDSDCSNHLSPQEQRNAALCCKVKIDKLNLSSLSHKPSRQEKQGHNLTKNICNKTTSSDSSPSKTMCETLHSDDKSAAIRLISPTEVKSKSPLRLHHDDKNNKANNTSSSKLAVSSFYSSRKKPCYEPKFFKARAKERSQQKLNTFVEPNHMYDFDSDIENEVLCIETVKPIEKQAILKSRNVLKKTPEKITTKRKNQRKNNVEEHGNDFVNEEDPFGFYDEAQKANISKKKIEKLPKQNSKIEVQEGKTSSLKVTTEISALSKKRQALQHSDNDENTFCFSLESAETTTPNHKKSSKKMNRSEQVESVVYPYSTINENNKITSNTSLPKNKDVVCRDSVPGIKTMGTRKKVTKKGELSPIPPLVEKQPLNELHVCRDAATSKVQPIEKEHSSAASVNRSKTKIKNVKSPEYQLPQKTGQRHTDVDVNIENSSDEEEDQENRLIVEENCGDADISTNVYDGEACLTSFAEACKGIVEKSSARKPRSKRLVNYRETSDSEPEETTPTSVERNFREMALNDITGMKEEYTKTTMNKPKKKSKKNIFSETDETGDTRSEVSWLASTARKKKPKLVRDYTHHHQEGNQQETIRNEMSESEQELTIALPRKPQKPRKKEQQTLKTPTHITAESSEGDLYYHQENKRQRLSKQSVQSSNLSSKTVHTRQIQVSEELRSHLGTPIASKNFVISHSFSTHDQTTSNICDAQITPVANSSRRKRKGEPPSIERARMSKNIMTPKAISPILPLDDSQEVRLSQVDLEDGELSPVSCLTDLSALKTPRTTQSLTGKDSLNFSALDAEELLICDSGDFLSKSGPCERRRSSVTTAEPDQAASTTDDDCDDEEDAPSSAGIRPRRLFTSETKNSPAVKTPKNKTPVRKPAPLTQVESDEELSEEDMVHEPSVLNLRLDMSAGAQNSPSCPEQSETEEAEPEDTSLCLSQEQPAQMDLGSGVSTIIKSFGSEIQRNMQMKKQKLEAITKNTLRSAESQVSSIWRDQHLHRYKTLCHLKTSVFAELTKLETDIEGIKDTERQAAVRMKQQLKLLENCRMTQHERLKNLKMLQTGFEREVIETDELQQNEQHGITDVLKQEIELLQKRLLKQTQQQEIQNVKRSLQMLFL